MIIVRLKVTTRRILNSGPFTDLEIPMAVRDHIHRYILRNLGTKNEPKKKYCCSFPDCTKIIHSKSLIIGKLTICWSCNESFILGNDQVRLNVVKPKCKDCRAKKVSNLPALKAKDTKENKIQDDAIEMLLKMRDL